MGYEKPATPLWYILAREPMAADDRVKITYDNDAFLFVAKSGERWIVDSELLTQDLQEIRDRYNAGEFEVVRCTGSGLQSGSVGSSLVIEAHGGGEYRGKRIRYTSLPIVTDISPAVRPANVQSVEVHFLISSDQRMSR